MPDFVKISDSIDSNSSVVAASSKAVSSVYDKAIISAVIEDNELVLTYGNSTIKRESLPSVAQDLLDNKADKADLDGKLDKSGGTMTGPLSLSSLGMLPNSSGYGEAGVNTSPAGPRVRWYKTDDPTYPGYLIMQGRTGSTITEMQIRPGLGVFIQDQQILTSAGGTMNGSLTSTFSPYNFIAKNLTLDSTVTPASNTYVGYEMRDKNDNRLAWAGYRKSVDGKDFYEVQVVGTQGKLTIYNDGKVTTNEGTVLTSANRTISTAAASGGANGDIWFQYV